MTAGIAGVIIGTDDLQRLVAFYRDVLGLRPRSVKAESAQFEWDGFRLTISSHSGVKGKNRDPDRIMINFAVQDIAASYERLAAAGVEFRRLPSRERWGWVATFSDPDGNTLQLLQLR
jgi:predicted enzyme related to lactoylglutathione lyase